jgi:membrane AbrB-like protein
MTSPSDPALLGRLPRAAQWLLLLLVSAVLAAMLFAVGLPAALLLGPMVAAIAAGVGGATVRVPDGFALAAQAIVAMLIASAITPEIAVTFLADWPLFVSIVLATIAASGALGWLMSHHRVLPGTTAVWGASPGASSAMVLMADAFGADARLVAFMQYLRVVMVATAASLVATFFARATHAEVPPVIWFPPLDAGAFATTIAVAALGTLVGRRLPVPSGALIVPMLAGSVLHMTGLIEIELPEWLLSIGYALVGWRIGLGFTRAVILHATRVLPQVFLSILVLMLFCAGLAAVLVGWLGVDPVTAYLATSPGGMDSVAIIAASSPVDVPFVMTLQVVRFFVIVLVGPSLAHFVARRMSERATSI